MVDTISWLELIWFFIVLFGVLASIKRVSSVIGDYRAVTRSGQNGVMLLQVKNDVRTECVRFVINSLLLALVINFLVLPNVHRPVVWNPTTILLTLVFLGSPLLRAFDSWRSEVNRRKIMRMLGNRK